MYISLLFSLNFGNTDLCPEDAAGYFDRYAWADFGPLVEHAVGTLGDA